MVKLTDVNQSIACRVRAEALTDATSSTVSPTPPSERSQPGIEGDPRLGRTLTCTRGAWDDNGRDADYAVTYEWYRAGVFVSNGAQYAVTAVDVGKVLRCQVVVEGLTTSPSPNLTAPGAAEPRARRRSPATPASAAASAATAARGTTRASTRTPSPTSGCAPTSSSTARRGRPTR